MEQLTYTDIKDKLFNRLQKTQKMCINIIKEENLDIVQNIYFKYYFDFSTAIEASITSIMAEKYIDDFARSKMKIFNRSTSNYIPKDDIKLLIESPKMDVEIKEIKDFYKGYVNVIGDGFYESIGLDKTIENYEEFTSFYNTSRDTRNQIAHGLSTSNVKYNDSMLFKFMLSFYVIHQYHIEISEQE